MSKKPLSDMTPSDFVRITGALHHFQNRMAKALNLSTATISGYSTGRQPIPMEVVVRLRELVQERIKECERLGHKIKQDNQEQAVSSLIVVSNTIRHAEPGRQHRLLRRGRPEDSRVYPAYRMPVARFNLFAEALAVYHAACIERRKQATVEKDIIAYDRELADLKVIAGNTKGIQMRGAPYDMMITHSEWFVVSRALRHETNDAKYSLYQHWRHHKGTGYPRA